MKEFVNLVLSGLVTGAIYSIMASGLVLTYTTSGIFNFAHGAVAFVTAYLYYQLNTGVGLPISSDEKKEYDYSGIFSANWHF